MTLSALITLRVESLSTKKISYPDQQLDLTNSVERHLSSEAPPYAHPILLESSL